MNCDNNLFTTQTLHRPKIDHTFKTEMLSLIHILDKATYLLSQSDTGSNVTLGRSAYKLAFNLQLDLDRSNMDDGYWLNIGQ